jgi:hypothetical protein
MTSFQRSPHEVFITGNGGWKGTGSGGKIWNLQANPAWLCPARAKIPFRIRRHRRRIGRNAWGEELPLVFFLKIEYVPGYRDSI